MPASYAKTSWQDYEFLSSGDGQRLECWGGVVVRRPESAAHWPWKNPEGLPPCGGTYSGDRAAGGAWHWRTPLPDPCTVSRGHLSFLIKPTASKHLGLFPEQEVNWDWIVEMLEGAETGGGTKPPRILNLFGYTGGATLAAASAGAAVTHVDAARAMVSWCSANARLSGLGAAPIRYIVEDSLTFLQREIRRGNRYDAVIMDPPAFGRGKGGELWKLSTHLPSLLDSAQEILSENPLFLLLNTYSDQVDDLAETMIRKHLGRLGGSCESVELGRRGSLDGVWLPCGNSYRWTA